MQQSQIRRGAYWHMPSGKWTAIVWFKGRNTYVGVYRDKKTALIAHDAVARFIKKLP